MLEGLKKSLKSSETDDWLDVKVVRPLAYLWALVFDKLGMHPNTVTIISMIIGAGSAYFFAFGGYYYGGEEGLWMNIIAIVMLLVADILDCTDGQLARLTGKTSRIGRILDGAAGFVWFVPIYLAIVYRFYYHHDIEFGWLGIENTEMNTWIATAVVLGIALVSGFAGIGGQQRMADYYIQVHLFFLKGEKGSELDSSVRQQQILDEMPSDEKMIYRTFQKSYVDYTRKQEARTPYFQQFMKVMKEKYGSVAEMPKEVREEFHRESLALMFWNGLLTFNFRTFWFILFCLLDIPVCNFLFEIVVMGLLCSYIVHRHENISKRLTAKL